MVCRFKFYPIKLMRVAKAGGERERESHRDRRMKGGKYSSRVLFQGQLETHTSVPEAFLLPSGEVNCPNIFQEE